MMAQWCRFESVFQKIRFNPKIVSIMFLLKTLSQVKSQTCNLYDAIFFDRILSLVRY